MTLPSRLLTILAAVVSHRRTALLRGVSRRSRGFLWVHDGCLVACLVMCLFSNRFVYNALRGSFNLRFCALNASEALRGAFGLY
jgi:hypothetical protein